MVNSQFSPFLIADLAHELPRSQGQAAAAAVAHGSSDCHGSASGQLGGKICDASSGIFWDRRVYSSTYIYKTSYIQICRSVYLHTHNYIYIYVYSYFLNKYIIYKYIHIFGYTETNSRDIIGMIIKAGLDPRRLMFAHRPTGKCSPVRLNSLGIKECSVAISCHVLM